MKSKKFVLAALALLAITGLLALAGCKNDSVPETPEAKQEQAGGTEGNNDSTYTEDNTSGGGDSGTVPPEVEKQEQEDGGGSETDKNDTVPETPETPKYLVTFDVGGNREARAPKPITVESGTELTAEQVPELSHTSSYQFMGWYLGDTEIKAGYTVTEPVTVTARWQGWLTFTAEGDQSLIIEGYGMKIPDSMEYSTDGSSWHKPGVGIRIPFGNGTKLYLRAKSSIGMADNSGAYLGFQFRTEVKVACSGDIRTLVDYTNPTGADTSNARFPMLFANCSQLTQAPELPAKTLADGCYSEMFKRCTSLTQAPELPAENLTDYCYYDMFSGCTSLTQAPELPAKTLADGCYMYMFSGCTGLTQAPELLAENLTDKCYSNMFSGCTSLAQAPKLSATILPNECYIFMFSGCTSLTQAPELPAKALADNCYEGMFSGCTGLTQAPELPAKALVAGCYADMFSGCKELNSVTMLATDVSASDALVQWLDDTADGGTLYVASGMATDPTITDSLPPGWTVEVAATN